MKVKMSNRMYELMDIVANELFCLWPLFIENVEAEGWSAERLESAVYECNDRKALRKLASQFV